MTLIDEAVAAIRHVVQEHGDDGTQLGPPARPGLDWFGRRLGWEWPPSYTGVLARHDGVVVQDAILFRFLESVEYFLPFHAAWHRLGYWPVATDGCGNYYFLAMGRRTSDDERPVVFVDVAESLEASAEVVAPCYASFVRTRMRAQCERLGCPG